MVTVSSDRGRVVIQILSMPFGKIVLFGTQDDLARFKVHKRISLDMLLYQVESRNQIPALYREVVTSDGFMHSRNCLVWPNKALAFLDDLTAQDLLEQVLVA